VLAGAAVLVLLVVLGAVLLRGGDDPPHADRPAGMPAELGDALDGLEQSVQP
jgi:hypothetical protein